MVPCAERTCVFSRKSDDGKVRKGCDTGTYGCCVAEFSHVTGFRLSLVAKSDDGGRINFVVPVGSDRR